MKRPLSGFAVYKQIHAEYAHRLLIKHLAMFDHKATYSQKPENDKDYIYKEAKHCIMGLRLAVKFILQNRKM